LERVESWSGVRGRFDALKVHGRRKDIGRQKRVSQRKAGESQTGCVSWVFKVRG